MSVQAKLFITLCKQTQSWAAHQRGKRVVCEVHEGCQRCCSLTPITLPLISPPWPPSSLLLRCSHWALVTIHRAADDGRRMSWLLKRSQVFISQSCDIFPTTFFAIYSSHLCATDQACWRGSQWNLQVCTCESMLRVCVFISSMWRHGRRGDCGCIWTLGSRPISLSHPQPCARQPRSFNQYPVPVAALSKLFEKSEYHEMAIIKLLGRTHLEGHCIKRASSPN